MTMMEQLIQMSRKYGANPDFVLAGGGNTSLKDGDVLFVKASGTSLSTIDENGFVAIVRSRLKQIWARCYSVSSARREAEVLEDLMASRQSGQTGRPSVETALHDLMDYRFVLHLHPALVNGLTCSKNGRAWTVENLKDEVVWLDATKPGFILAAACRTLIESYRSRCGFCPHMILIENHGVFFAADTLPEIDALVETLMDKIRRVANRVPDFTSVPVLAPIEPILEAIRSLVPEATVVQASNRGIRGVFADEGGIPLIQSPFTPDHIVYCGPYPLYTDLTSLVGDYGRFVRSHGFSPKVILVRGAGLFALGKSPKLADLARDLFIDEIKILFYSHNFGGPLFMTPEDIDFILHWEVENYRVKAVQS